jgi:putative hydrolase of the HAD superfamily
MTIQAVFFDMGGTIETYRYTREFRIQNAAVLQDCLHRAGVAQELDDEQLVDTVTQGIAAYHHWNLETMIELPPAEIWTKYVFGHYPNIKKKIALIGEELAFLYETRFYIREMRPEMPEALEKIKKLGLRIGCISNTQSLTQVPASLREYGILDYFDPIVLSSKYGRRKPDAAIFYQTARLANLPTSSCVYVGDKLNRDILGAQRAGYRAAIQIHHQYDDGEMDGGATPDAVIKNMLDLLPIMEGIIDKDRFISSGNHRKIKAIFFDAGDVLYYRPEKSPNFTKFLEGRAISPPPDLHRQHKKIKDLAYQGKMRRHVYFERLVKLYGIQDEQAVAEGVAALSHDEDQVGIFEGVPDTINALKTSGFLLAIITDTAMPFSKKLAWFDEHGFGRVWDVVISSKELGVRKPSPEMYQKALSQAGVSSEEAIFVGHKKSELDGAKAMGIKTVAFNYDRDAIADIYINHFSDLLMVPFLEM